MRTVDYTADPVHGFNAVVSKTAPTVHHQPVHHAPAHIPAPVKPVIHYITKPIPVPVEIPRHIFNKQIYSTPTHFCKYYYELHFNIHVPS